MHCIFDFIQTLPGGFYEGYIKLNLDDLNTIESNKINLVLKIPSRNDIFPLDYKTSCIEFDSLFEMYFLYLHCTLYELYYSTKRLVDDKIIETCKISLKELYELLKKYKKEGDVENEKRVQSEISNILAQNKNNHQSRILFEKFNQEVFVYQNTINDKLKIIYSYYKVKIQKTLKPILSFEVFERTILEMLKDFSRLIIEYFKEYLSGIRERKSFWCNCKKCQEEKNIYINDKMLSIQDELENILSLFSLYHSSLFIQDS